MDDEKKTISVNLSIREWILIIGLISASFGGFSVFGGQAEQAISDQTEALTGDFEKLFNTLSTAVEQNSEVMRQNTIRIYEMEMKDRELLEHTDSLHGVTTRMIINLEGYFKGQIDARNED